MMWKWSSALPMEKQVNMGFNNLAEARLCTPIQYVVTMVSPSCHTDSSDYTFSSLTATITPASSSPVCVSFDATQDTAVEGEHSFTVSINGGMPSDVVTVGAPSSQEVVITDDDGMH